MTARLRRFAGLVLIALTVAFAASAGAPDEAGSAAPCAMGADAPAAHGETDLSDRHASCQTCAACDLIVDQPDVATIRFAATRRQAQDCRTSAVLGTGPGCDPLPSLA